VVGFAAVKAGRSSLAPSAAFVALAAAAALAVGAVSGVLGTTGCKSCDNGSSGDVADSGHAQPTSLTPEQSKQTLAKVGDDTITLGDYAAALEHMDQFDRLRYQSTERRKELLDEMITVQLLAKEATAKGYDKDPIAQQEMRAIQIGRAHV
jgi:peptidyl-prolyl cis-trans isomerase C